MHTERYTSCTMAFVMWFDIEISIDITVNPTTWTLHWWRRLQRQQVLLVHWVPFNQRIKRLPWICSTLLGIKEDKQVAILLTVISSETCALLNSFWHLWNHVKGHSSSWQIPFASILFLSHWSLLNVSIAQTRSSTWSEYKWIHGWIMLHDDTMQFWWPGSRSASLWHSLPRYTEKVITQSPIKSYRDRSECRCSWDAGFTVQRNEQCTSYGCKASSL